VEPDFLKDDLGNYSTIKENRLSEVEKRICYEYVSKSDQEIFKLKEGIGYDAIFRNSETNLKKKNRKL